MISQMNKLTRYNAYISAISHFVPPKIISNKYFEEYLDTTDEWITERSGISERRYLEKDQPVSYAAIKAVDLLLEDRGISPEEIDLIIVATVTADMNYPSTACIIQNAIGANNCWGFDLSGACSGFLFALSTGAQFVENRTCKKVLVIGADKMSSIIDPMDRNTCILFGDGAAAVLLEPTENKAIGILDSILRIDGVGGKYLRQPAGGSLNPSSAETVEKRMHFVQQDGRAVFKDAVIGMANVSEEIMIKNNLSANDIAYLVPHQANLRIISATAERMGITMEKVMLNIDKYGNTTAASIPLCISEYWKNGKIKKDDNLILSSFGAGYTWGSILLKWAL